MWMPLMYPCIKVANVDWFFGSGALSGKMLLLRIVEYNKIDAYYRAG